MQVLNKFRQLDAYPKINEDFYKRTLAGGFITIISTFFMILLFSNELRTCLNTVVVYALCLLP